MDELTLVAVVLGGVSVGLLGLLVFLVLARTRAVDLTPILVPLDALRDGSARLEGILRDELRANRTESSEAGRLLRTEVGVALQHSSESLVQSVGEISTLQRDQLEALRAQLNAMLERNEQRLQGMQTVVDGRLNELREDNRQQLERMRVTVDEKLHATLERRLGESFKLVSDRLEAVHKGLGEMQSLANGVGDLKRVLTNVKTRGTWGEIQLGALLEQVLAPDQYAANVATKPGSAERVEFALRLPGRNGVPDEVVWLPIDAKFPQEDYQRLLDAQDRADPDGVADAGKSLEAQIKGFAKRISEKYLNPPHTTDFGLMFLPTEGLYAEVIRRPGLVDGLQRDWRVIVAGPTTLAALLNSLQMGFRTLAVEQRSSEVWRLLGSVKTEFQNFGAVLDKVHKKLGEASDSIETAAKRSKTIERKLRGVDVLPAADERAALITVETPPIGPAEAVSDPAARDASKPGGSREA